MKRRVFLTAVVGSILLLLFSQSLAQPHPDTLWTRTYGGSSLDEAYSVQQTTDGGYVVAGYTYSFGVGTPSHCNMYLVRMNSQGEALWTWTCRGRYNEWAYSVQQTTDRGYVVAGCTMSFGAGAEDLYLVKTDSQGGTLWTSTYGGSNWDEARSVQQTTDSGYVVAGFTYSFGVGTPDHPNMYLVKTNSQGDTLWTRTYGGSDWDEACSVRQTTDGGYIVAGETQSFGAGCDDFYLVKTNGQGDTLWTRTYGGSNEDCAYSVRQTADGGYIVAGFTYSFGAGYADSYVVKTDSLGDTLWTRTYGGSQSDMANSVQQTSDGGYVVGGRTNSFSAGSHDFYLVKTNGQGDTLWTRTYGGSGYEKSFSIQQTADGAFILAGRTNSFGAGGTDIYLVKTGPDISFAEPLKNPSPTDYALCPAYPNPFNPSAQITFALPKAGEVSLKVFNLLGQEVATLAHGMQSAGMHTVFFDGSGLPTGIYFYHLDSGNFIQTRKMMLLK